MKVGDVVWLKGCGATAFTVCDVQGSMICVHWVTNGQIGTTWFNIAVLTGVQPK